MFEAVFYGSSQCLKSVVGEGASPETLPELEPEVARYQWVKGLEVFEVIFSIGIR